MDDRKNEDRIIGDRINTALAKADMTQKELAEAMGIKKGSENTISRYCNGSIKPNSETIVNMAKKLGVPAGYLLGDDVLPTRDNAMQVVHAYTGLSEESIDFIVSNQKFLIQEINDFLPNSFEFFVGMKNARMQSRRAEEYIKDEDCNSDSRLIDLQRNLKYLTFDLMESEGRILNQCYRIEALADEITQILKKRHEKEEE